MTEPAPLTLEERVTRLEELLGHPLIEMTVPELDEHEVRDLEKQIGDALKDHPGVYRVLPPRPLLTPETARELLRECVTVVRPGEVLVIRTPESWAPRQIGEVQRYVNEAIEYRELGITVMFLPGEEFAVAKGEAA